MNLAVRRVLLNCALVVNSLPGALGSVRNATSSNPATRQEKSRSRIGILLAEDHLIVRMGIRSFLNRHPNLQLLDEAKDGLEALKKTRELKPDIVLSDIDMPHLDGLALTEILRSELPEIKVVLLSGLSAPPLIKRILQSGARGFLSKQASSEELLRALETVASGDTFFSSEVARLVLNRLVGNEWLNPNASKLSQREQEVIILIADGLSNKEIAARLEIGSRTVETHREHIMRKLNLHSTAGLTTYAVANGFVQLPAV